MTSAYLLKNGRLVNGDGWYQADLRIRRRRITEIGSGLKVEKRETEVDCSGCYIYPGLINSHDHLEFNLFPQLGAPPYSNAYEWGRDLHKRWSSTIQTIQSIPLNERLLWGAWKNLFSGVTRVAHHNKYFDEFRRRFPLDVVARYTFAHSLQFEGNLQRALRRRRRNTPFVIHLAEGKDESSYQEARQLESMGGIDGRTVAVHSVAIVESDVQLFQQANASVVWCPSSNLYLFGKTAPVDSLYQRVQVALGTDSTLSGAITLFDELRIARSASSLSASQLFRLVTDTPRHIFRLPLSAGSLIEGGAADLFLLPATLDDAHENLLGAAPADICLLMKNGRVVYHQSGLFHQKGNSSDGFVVSLDGREKIIRDHNFPRLYQSLRPYVSHYTYLQSRKRLLNERSPLKRFVFTCPSCHMQLQKFEDAWECARESYTFKMVNGMPDFILPSRRQTVDRFLSLYQSVRNNERWGSKDAQYYRKLPYSDATNEHTRIWKIRAGSYDCLIQDLERDTNGSPRIVLDLGAGNCWMSLRLAELGYKVTAVDVNVDSNDGLGVAQRIRTNGSSMFESIRAEFDYLPFAKQSFDLIIFNASLHYAENPIATLLNCVLLLKEQGAIYVLDSPIYRDSRSGESMVAERIEEFQMQYSIPLTVEFAGKYLTFEDLQQLRAHCKVSLLFPHYGLTWKLRPLTALIRGKREPASFLVVKIQKS